MGLSVCCSNFSFISFSLIVLLIFSGGIGLDISIPKQSLIIEIFGTTSITK